MKNNTHKNITNTSYTIFTTYEKSRQKSTKTIRVTLRSCEISLYNILLKNYYYSPIILKYVYTIWILQILLILHLLHEKSRQKSTKTTRVTLRSCEIIISRLKKSKSIMRVQIIVAVVLRKLINLHIYFWYCDGRI